MSNKNNTLKAVIFDMDGTIIDTDHIWKKVTKTFLESNGITQISEEHKKALDEISSGGLIKTATAFKQIFNIPRSIEEIVTQKELLLENYIKNINIEFISGFQIFHKKLIEANISTGLATNANFKTLNILNSKVNLNNFFGENIYSMEHIGNKAKPDPSLFLHAIEKLKVSPNECIIFEDSIQGFTAAKEAGIKCIAIKNESNKKYLQQVHGTIEDYRQAEAEIIKFFQILKKN